jgi:hypothetical protein
MIGFDQLVFTAFDRENSVDWDAFATASAFCWTYHESDWLRAEAALRRYRNCSYSIRADGKIVGLICLFVQKKFFGLILTGPGIAADLSILEADARHRLFQWVEEKACELKCLSVRLHICSFAPANRSLAYFDSALAQNGYGFGFRGDSLDYEAGCLIVADLARCEKQILNEFTKGNKASVNRVAKMALATIVSAEGSCDDHVWNDFVALNNMTMRRGGTIVPPPSHFEALRRLLQRGQGYLFSLYRGDECLVAIYLVGHKGVALYESAGSTDEASKIGALAYIHYVAMRELKGRGFDFYCMGPDVPSAGRTKDRQISTFKRRFGNQRWDNLVGEKILAPKRYFLFIIVPGFLQGEVIPKQMYAAVSALKRWTVG